MAYSSDLKSELARRKTATTDLLSSQQSGLDAEIARTRAAIQARRGGFLQSLGIGGEAGVRENTNLDRSLSSALANRQLSTGRGNLQSRYDLYGAREQQGLNDYNNAVGYSRQNVSDAVRRQFQEAQRIAAEQSAMRNEKTTDTFNYQKNALANIYGTPQSPYEAAMTRAMFGLVGAGTTAYALNKSNPNPTTMGNVVGPGNTLTSQTAFSPRQTYATQIKGY